MTDEDALLAAAAAAPDDDAPRLAYADWLDEHGRPDRAEFIRAQCRIARGAAAFGDEERAFELEEVNRGRWLVGLPGGEGVVWTFRRGFPDVVHAPADVFLSRYDRFAAVPWVRALCAWDVSNSAVRDFVSRPWNPGWADLEFAATQNAAVSFRAVVSTPAVLALASSPQVSQLYALRLAHFVWTPEAVRALADSPHLDRLAALVVDVDLSGPLFDPLRETFGDRLYDWLS